MSMFPSNEPVPPSKPLFFLQSTHGKRFRVGLVVCYVLIVFCWASLQLITVTFPHLMYDGPVVSAYLVYGQVTTNQELGVDPALSAVDMYTKIILLLLNGFIGTMFLLIFVWPKMENKNVWVITSLMLVGYSIPLLNNLWNVLFNNDLLNYLTLNKIFIMTLNAPLTWSLILFGYYLYEEVLKEEQS